MNKILLGIALILILNSCQNGPSQQEYDNLKIQLEQCSQENEELKNTLEKRLLSAQKLETEGNLNQAETEYRELVEKFPKSEESKIAQKFIDKVEKEKEEKRIEEERRKQLGFKALKERATIEQGDVKLSFSSIKLTKRWYFDRYGDTYHYRDAERGSKNLTATLSITSKTNEPNLPPTYVYKLEDGQLKYLATITYEFYRWKDYGSYLGNYSDYGNDFAHSQTIRFSPGTELTDEDTKSSPIFLMVKKDNCVSRSYDRFGRPPVSYSTLECNYDRTLTVEKAESDYYTIKIFNKEKI